MAVRPVFEDTFGVDDGRGDSGSAFVRRDGLGEVGVRMSGSDGTEVVDAQRVSRGAGRGRLSGGSVWVDARMAATGGGTGAGATINVAATRADACRGRGVSQCRNVMTGWGDGREVRTAVELRRVGRVNEVCSVMVVAGLSDEL